METCTFAQKAHFSLFNKGSGRFIITKAPLRLSERLGGKSELCQKRSKFHTQFCLGMLSHISSAKICFVFEILHSFMPKKTRFFLVECFFCICCFSKMKSNPVKKTSEQCFSGKRKPTCQNIASLEHFQKWPKNLEGVQPFNYSPFRTCHNYVVTYFHCYLFSY